MAEEFSVDRKTLRKAISVLVDEGILTRIHGKGTYINKRQVSYDLDIMDNFSQMLQRSGMKHECRLLYKEKRKAGFKYAKILQINEDDDVYRLVRLRYGDGEPLALQDTYIVYDIIEDIESIDFEMYSLYDVLNQHGIYASRMDETFSFIELSSPETKLLGVPEGSISFMTEDTTYDQNGKIVEYTKGLTNNNKLDISMTLKK
ncbi:GntR family transcriptional regulator [Oscillospiraceae bacterium NSJ-64]|uniref:GntR family transcriptional regulator n=2 Tax=Youxingia wuxianensis TaxID=2763678 RepID=A0A926EMM9_9FIRM|nr:GntR family transcriptional regulator [Youxingia wuxianensis]